ncbi:hypothetical protein C2G38_2231403 [Gigaspora rosea]|uniref:Uncharacterized protein n=1 Tax=Gigaspora rosea TaxID=44941 RepID=A0A397U1I6_9GLOM|nr:hypothetical protein C2G38_2231403 [Gigaspora rosea]
MDTWSEVVITSIYYINQSELNKHENATHKNYNIIRSGIFQLLADHIAEFKRMLVHAIQKWLPLYFSRSGKQLVKFPCTDVGVFSRYITQFSLAKSSYYCIFKSKNADNILSEIFENQQWDLEDEATELYVYKQATDLDANFLTSNRVDF